MVQHSGYRSGTRYMFARGFRKHGIVPLTAFMQKYRLGDMVDVKVNGSIHKGMPHKNYHGKTGRVWNVSRRAIGIEINKRVRNRVVVKRIHARLEHIRPSKCNADFKQRCRDNLVKAEQAKATGTKVCLKRQPTQPREAEVVVNPKVIEVHPVAYAELW
ncbi:hypothetical protein RCL1_000318 [Eukaryota sp. TZLM3-RCL]